MDKLDLINRLGVARVFRFFNRQRVVVLMYHGVLPDDEPLAEQDWLHIPVSEFRAQMAFLHKHYQTVSLLSLLDNSAPHSTKPRAVITFDDGFANNFQHALPVLAEFSLPATIFVTTSFIGTKKLFWWDRLRLSMNAHHMATPADWVKQLKQLPPKQIDTHLDNLLASVGVSSIQTAPDSYRCMTVSELNATHASELIDIGSHTHNHEIIEHLADTELTDTLHTSLTALQGWGIGTGLFAAPNGDYLDRQIPLLKQLGFSSCASTQERLWNLADTPYRIPRYGIGRGTSLARFALLTSGFLSFLKRIAGREKANTGTSGHY